MDSLSTVNTIVRIAQDLSAAIATVGKNNNRCKKLAERVKGIGDQLRELDNVATGKKMDPPTQRLLGRLQKTLSESLRLVRSWQSSSCPCNFFIGGRMAEQLDEVDRDIDRCLLDLSISNLILFANLEKQVHQQNEAASTETLTLRIGMQCDDNADQIKRSIRTIQGVTEVSAVASTKDKFMVTIRSGAIDISSLLHVVREQLNRNVEVVKKYDIKDHKKKAKHKRAVEERSDKQKHVTSVEQHLPWQPPPMTMAGVNLQASDQYIYLPVKLVPAGYTSSTYPAPAPHGFMPYPNGPPPGNYPVHDQRQFNPHHVHFKDTSANQYESAKNTIKDGDKDKKTAKMPEHVSKGGGVWDEGEKATAFPNATPAYGVPLHTVTANVPELVPPPTYGYWPNAHGHSTGCCCHHNAAGPSDPPTAHNNNHDSSYQYMFSDENPNACSIL
ncbi:hypothetical protein QOZ80_5BG0424730 [Eleusine coracana subsp. coracana]|nr:hypothetical protein QOZ80_5BG0424730 [Eleusine coracana subsp. coracana]